MTEISTPLVYAWLTLSAAQGLAWALIAGLGFGLGRSMPSALGALGVGRGLRPEQVSDMATVGYPRLVKWAGVSTASAALASLAFGHLLM